MNLILLPRNLELIKKILPNNSQIGFIPTAGDVYENPYFVVDDKKKLLDNGYKVIDIDITNEDYNEIKNKLHNIDALFVAGGNVYYLMQQIKEKNLEKLIIEYIKSNKLYIGSSAGSCICSPSLKPYQTLDDKTKAPNLKDLNGLNIVDFVVLPHYGKEKYQYIYDNILKEYDQDFNLVTLKDDETIIVTEKDKYEIIKLVN